MLSVDQVSILIIINAIGSLITAIQFAYSIFLLDDRQKRAYQGDVLAAKRLILPCYRPLYIGFTIYFTLLCIGELLTLIQDNISIKTLYFILQVQSLFILTAFLISPILFIQHSVSKRGFILTSVYIIPWFIITAACLVVTYAVNSWKLTVDIIFLFLAFLPPFCLSVGILSRLVVSRIRLGSKSNRNSTEHLLIFVVVFSQLNLLVVIDPSNDSTIFALLMAYVVVAFIWSQVFCLAIHRSLLADTKFWRGLGTHNKDGIVSAGIDNLPHPGLDFAVASTYFQEMMSSIGSLVIDFAYLEAKDKIGEGSTAVVYNGQYKGADVAIKMYTPDEITLDVITQFVKEGKLSYSLSDHSNIVRFHGLCVRPPQIAFVTELCDEGNLKSSLKNSADKWTAMRRLKACLDAARSLEHLHSKNYIHRDLKTENYFVTKDFSVKLGDFGETTMSRPAESLNGERMDIVGTVSYMAPELIAAAKHYTSAIDVYALAVTFWEIWTGEDCYAEMSQFDIYKYVGSGNRPDVSNLNASPLFLEVMVSGWHQEPDKRPTANQLVKSLEEVISLEKDQNIRFDDIYNRNRGKDSLSKQGEAKASSFVQSILPFFLRKPIATKYDSVPKQVDDVEAPPSNPTNDRNNSDIK